MEWDVDWVRKCLTFAGVIILVVGLGSAALIYLKAPSYMGSVLGYDSEGGYEYPIMPDDSKQYIRGLELYGGTANVLADDLRRWFDGLWHGKSLAYIVAFITIVISAGVLYVANNLRPRKREDNQEIT
jgi:hypothetical protein